MSGLTVSMIVRNEERNLARALASVADVADEIIVTDTGSVDGTLDIARRYGARISQIPWPDDFSAARNHGAGLASQPWIFMLDADEELLTESRDELARCTASESALAFTVTRQDLADEQRLDVFTEMWQLRLVRNRPDLRMTGRIHEHYPPALLEIAAREQLTVTESRVRIRHYGYVAKLKEEKNKRAARLLELELAERPGQFYYLVELGRTLLALGDARAQDRLAEAAQMVVASDLQVEAGPLAMLLEHVLANPRLPDGFPLSRERARELALTKFPDAVPLLWHIAAAHNQRGEFSECARFLERILTLRERHSYDHLVSFDPSIMGDDALLNLGACYVRMGQLKKGEECFRRLADSPTRKEQAAENLRAIRRLRRR